MGQIVIIINCQAFLNKLNLLIFISFMTSFTHARHIFETRMHSSRMRTVRCSSRLLGGGGEVSASQEEGRVCLPAGGCTPLPPCGQTDTCENITFPQLLLRTVKIYQTCFKIIIGNLTQSLSKMTTVSAAVKLTPRPPALVLTRKTNISGSLLNLSIWIKLFKIMKISILISNTMN